jgi:hypothetical protein
LKFFFVFQHEQLLYLNNFDSTFSSSNTYKTLQQSINDLKLILQQNLLNELKKTLILKIEIERGKIKNNIKINESMDDFQQFLPFTITSTVLLSIEQPTNYTFQQLYHCLNLLNISHIIIQYFVHSIFILYLHPLLYFINNVHLNYQFRYTIEENEQIKKLKWSLQKDQKKEKLKMVNK